LWPRLTHLLLLHLLLLLLLLLIQVWWTPARYHAP
jgi:hypothetical protein